MITSSEIQRRLWNGANELRGSMDASRYKDYMLGLMFYKFLSDKTLQTAKVDLNVDFSGDELVQCYQESYEKYGKALPEMIQKGNGYVILPEHLYQSWVININKGNFSLQSVTDSLNAFEQSIIGSAAKDDFVGLFSGSTLDLTDTALGSNLKARSDSIKSLIMLFADLNMIELQKNDVLGDAYEYLIGQFAMESGKKAGEFYTPHQVSEVIAQIIVKSTKITSIYDPTVGSGSLLLTVKNHLNEEEQKNLHYYGQELNTATYNLTRMNLLLHDVKPSAMTIRNNDTLAQDWPEDEDRPNEGILFDAVVMNPPYSYHPWNKSGLTASDPRFSVAGILPPDNKGDYAFLLHGLYHVGTGGAMGIVLPHGVLFRGGAEGEIRQRLIEKNYIDTIIGLPANLFTNTGIPVVVIILKKNRPIDAPILLIDASKGFVKQGKQNALRERDIAKIVDTYTNRTGEAGYSCLASRQDIMDNEYNLNIPRYVTALVEDMPHDVDAHLFGGIPVTNIQSLAVLPAIVPDILQHACEELRPGYVGLVKSIEELRTEILQDERVLGKTKQLQGEATHFVNVYWDTLRGIGKENTVEIHQFKELMLSHMKDILQHYTYIDIYSGYQVIADIWRTSLEHDLKIISESDFYTAGRLREPNMVTKGTGDKKREEQDGWNGLIVANDLVEKQLYSSERQAIENKKNRVNDLDNELADLLERAKVEDSEEETILGDTLSEDKNSFQRKVVKAFLKKAVKGTTAYTLLAQVEDIFAEGTKFNKEIKADERELKNVVEERILQLTEDEIDQLMYEKWFGHTVQEITALVGIPILKDLDMLKLLQDRYADTLDDIDKELLDLEAQFAELQKDLVVQL